MLEGGGLVADKMSRLLSGLVQSIINRYLQKWLKNVTTEHATIWGGFPSVLHAVCAANRASTQRCNLSVGAGEMVFKNVELRLDVLQEELGLPLVFTRGFIQELRVYVPLASLLRDNIKFTLTNLEVVASTPAETTVRARAQKSPAAGHSPSHGPDKHRTRHASEDAEKQPSWMHSVLQRVLQNVGVEVRNLVFKYTTDSYVSSVSWKSLSLASTNARWEHCFANPGTCSPRRCQAWAE